MDELRCIASKEVLAIPQTHQLGRVRAAPATEGASAKLARVLPDALRESIQTVEKVVAVEPGPWVISTSADCLLRAASAIRMSRRVKFAYRSHAGTDSHREIEPYAVIHSDGRWYLIGHCLSREVLRTFRLDRVASVEICAEAFQRPTNFDAHAHLRERMPFVQSEFQIDVWIDLPIEQAEQTFAPWRVATERDGGGTRLRCGRDRLQMFAAMLLSMGRRIVIHEPAELRGTFRELALQAMQAAQPPEAQPIGAAPQPKCS